MPSAPFKRSQESERIYRCRSNSVAAVIWLVISIGFAISFVLRAPDSPSIIILAVLFGVVATFILARLLFAAIWVLPSGLRVANLFETFDLQWQDIERFEMGRWKILPRTCLIHLRDGRVKHAAGVEESVNFPKGDAVKMVEQLNGELREKLTQRTVAVR
jgi:uncharacterized membrane protein YraQ (UPF0718 family)